MRSSRHGASHATADTNDCDLKQETRMAVAAELNAMADTYGSNRNTPESDRRFLTDANQTGWLDHHTKDQLQQMLDRTDLDQSGLVQLTSLLETSRNLAMMHAHDTVNDWDRHTSDKNLLIRLMQYAHNRAGTRALLKSTQYWPPSSPATGDPDVDRSAVTAAETVMETVLADRENGSWRRQSITLEFVALELDHYHQTGEPPQWFKPAAMTLSKEMEDLGYTIINPDPPAPDDTQAMASYIRERMRLFLPPKDGNAEPTSLEHNVNATVFADSFINPYVNWELAGYDGVLARPLQYHHKLPEERRTVEGDTTDPMNHARVSYRVALQTCMSHRDLQVQVAAYKPESLADLVYRASTLLPNMEDHCLTTADHMAQEGTAVRRRMRGYNPPVRWKNDPRISLRNLNQLTDNFKDVAPLQEKLNKVIEYLVDTHLRESLERQAQYIIEQHNMNPADAAHELANAYRWATRTPSGIQRMRCEGPAEENDPQTLLITEAMEAIFHVKEELARLTTALSGEDLMPLEENEKPLYRQETRNIALNRLSHADYCLVAATRYLPFPRPESRTQTLV